MTDTTLIREAILMGAVRELLRAEEVTAAQVLRVLLDPEFTIDNELLMLTVFPLFFRKKHPLKAPQEFLERYPILQWFAVAGGKPIADAEQLFKAEDPDDHSWEPALLKSEFAGINYLRLLASQLYDFQELRSTRFSPLVATNTVHDMLASVDNIKMLVEVPRVMSQVLTRLRLLQTQAPAYFRWIWPQYVAGYFTRVLSVYSHTSIVNVPWTDYAWLKEQAQSHPVTHKGVLFTCPLTEVVYAEFQRRAVLPMYSWGMDPRYQMTTVENLVGMATTYLSAAEAWTALAAHNTAQLVGRHESLLTPRYTPRTVAIDEVSYTLTPEVLGQFNPLDVVVIEGVTRTHVYLRSEINDIVITQLATTGLLDGDNVSHFILKQFKYHHKFIRSLALPPCRPIRLLQDKVKTDKVSPPETIDQVALIIKNMATSTPTRVYAQRLPKTVTDRAGGDDNDFFRMMAAALLRK